MKIDKNLDRHQQVISVICHFDKSEEKEYGRQLRLKCLEIQK